jgi:hypothetical protein
MDAVCFRFFFVCLFQTLSFRGLTGHRVSTGKLKDIALFLLTHPLKSVPLSGTPQQKILLGVILMASEIGYKLSQSF